MTFGIGISLLPYGTYIKSSKSYYIFTFSYNTNISIFTLHSNLIGTVSLCFEVKTTFYYIIQSFEVWMKID